MEKLLTLKDWAVSIIRYNFSVIEGSCGRLHGIDGRNEGMLNELREICNKWLVTITSDFNFNDEEFATDICTVENYIYHIDTVEEIDRYAIFGIAYGNINLMLCGLR